MQAGSRVTVLEQSSACPAFVPSCQVLGAAGSVRVSVPTQSSLVSFFFLLLFINWVIGGLNWVALSTLSCNLVANETVTCLLVNEGARNRGIQTQTISQMRIFLKRGCGERA